MTADNDLEFRAQVKAGTRLVAVAFTERQPSALEGRGRRSAGAGIDTLQIAGPFDGRVPADTPSRRQIFVCKPTGSLSEEACARKIIDRLVRRAYRRPATEADIDSLIDIYRSGRDGGDFDSGIELVLEALLSSPKFLIRVEAPPVRASAGTTFRLSDFELASRLSFFLWKSIPDDELLDLAARGRLSNPAVLGKQVSRMLADRRATRFAADFVEQWLQVRNLQTHEPDAQIFTGFDPTLRDAMVHETQLFFTSQVREDRPLPELLRANYTYVNEALARHYGITSVYGSHFRRVTLADERRFGLLGQASVLTTSSYPNRTSVVLRGKYVLENLLGAPPPPPPANVPPLKENTPGAKPAALRERMEQHRANPTCAACHTRMDPLGFALENYDAIGRWRTTDEGAPIDSTVELSGKKIDSPRAFREALLAEGDGAFVRTVIDKLLTYALGRGVTYADAPTGRRIARELAQSDYRWSTLVLAIVTSDQFQKRQAPGAAATAAAAAR